MGSPSHAPVGNVDRTILMSIKQRLETAPYIQSTRLNLKHRKPTLTATFAQEYFPTTVEEAYYDIRWYTSGDFEIHYQENWTDDREWKQRWDSHPRQGKRTHYHPPPDAGVPGKPANLPNHYYDMLRHADRETFDHIESHPLFDEE